MSKSMSGIFRTCGANRNRTGNLCLARAALSQLSYSPFLRSCIAFEKTFDVGLGRFELPTSRLSGVRSNHLSYKPIIDKEKCDVK